MLRSLPVPTHPDLLVGSASGDDAAVWRLDDERALVFTADVITPVVDDARTWGRVVAANAVSDVYAMGGRPLGALSLVGWNRDELPLELLTEALQGVADVAAEGGFVVVGGHSIADPEPKLGLAVFGTVHPDRMLTNAGLRPGDTIVLTKPLGIGVVTTAIKRGVAPEAVVARALALMTLLNGPASEVALAAGATGATDVTGFGLVGHLGRMALESQVDVVVDATSVPVLGGARELCAAGVSPGGTDRNLDGVAGRFDPGGADEITVRLLADPQTSGGLVFGVDEARVVEVLAGLAATGHRAAAIGRAARGTGRITLR